MNAVSRARALLPRILYALLVIAGLLALLKSAVAAQGGFESIWRFSHDGRHRLSAMAMLTGTLRLRSDLELAANDEQIYNGAGYTNWGYGSGLLELPFQALASKLRSPFPTGFFPDRAIYFIYLTVLIPLLWMALNRLLLTRQPGRLKRYVLGWAGALSILTYTLYPLMSARFRVYEQTICFFILCEFFALCAYVFSFDARTPSRRLVWIGAIGVAAGLGLAVRVTGLIYLGVWAMLVLLEFRSVKTIVSYLGAAAPFVVFWLYSNWVKGGSPFSFGYQNSTPWFQYHTPIMRFGDHLCVDSLAHTWDAARELFEWMFVAVTAGMDGSFDDRSPHLKQCHFDYELRPPAYHEDAMMGLPVFILLVWILFHYVVRRERRLAVYVPFVAFAFLFANFVTGPGLAWRYIGDFWPFVVIIVVQYIQYLPRKLDFLLGLRLAFVLFVCSFASYEKNVSPALRTLEILDDRGVADMQKDFERTRWHLAAEEPSHLSCGKVPDRFYHNGQGWNSSCGVDTFTNVFLGVPQKQGNIYDLQFRTEGISKPSLRVYLNGKVYTAYRAGDRYVAHVRLDYAKLFTPTVMMTVEWTSVLEPPPHGKLLDIELG